MWRKRQAETSRVAELEADNENAQRGVEDMSVRNLVYVRMSTH
jgi:hypothetical protein